MENIKNINRFFILSHEIFSPIRKLFEFSDDDMCLLQLGGGVPREFKNTNTTTNKDDINTNSNSNNSDISKSATQTIQTDIKTYTTKDFQSNVNLDYYVLTGRILGMYLLYSIK